MGSTLALTPELRERLLTPLKRVDTDTVIEVMDCLEQQDDTLPVSEYLDKVRPRLLDILVEEITTALRADGGVAGAQAIIARIEAGQMTGDYYYDDTCTCFYGGLIVNERGWQPKDVEAGAAAAYSSDNGFVQDACRPLMSTVLSTTSFGAAWQRRHSPIELALMTERVYDGQTHVKQPILAFLRDVLLLYIEQHPAVA